MPKPTQNSHTSKLSRSRALEEHQEKVVFSYERVSRPRAPGEHGKKVAFSCGRVSMLGALGQQGA
jgi:hypothetical protein